ncbi:MAG: phage hypothetical protein [Bacteroidetes bacterium HLUCCA01]|nr:MAG: phage hypothetical protein [Bacteroidetes bacterium HLUCCA01]
MIDKPSISQKVFNHFKDQSHFTRGELHDFLRKENPGLSDGTFGWRVNDLKKKNIIQQVKTGIYTVHVKMEFHLQQEKSLWRFLFNFGKDAGYPKLCIWNTQVLERLSKNHNHKNHIILEVKPTAIEQIYNCLSKTTEYIPYINRIDASAPTYEDASKNPVVIKRLIPRSPIKTIYWDLIHFPFPTLEKILVDILMETNIKDELQRTHLIGLFDNAINSYVIDFSKLYNYADRRGKLDDIRHFIHVYLPHHNASLF